MTSFACESHNDGAQEEPEQREARVTGARKRQNPAPDMDLVAMSENDSELGWHDRINMVEQSSENVPEERVFEITRSTEKYVSTEARR